MSLPFEKSIQLGNAMRRITYLRFSEVPPTSPIRLAFATIDAIFGVLFDFDADTGCCTLHLDNPAIQHAILERAIITAIREAGEVQTPPLNEPD